METRPSPFAEKLSSYLSYLEIGGLLIAALGLALLRFQFASAREMMLVGFSALAGVYFLSAFMIPPATASDNNADTPKGGFLDLFAKSIGRKIIYLGCSVTTIGLLFGMLGMRGSEQMLLLGCSTLVIASVLAGLLILRNNAFLAFLQAPLTRAVPLAILSLYWIYMH